MAQFGLLEFKGQVAGVTIQQLVFGETASEAEALNEDGDIEQIDQYGRKRTVQGDGNLKAGSEFKLEAGATLTVNGVTYKLNSVTQTRTNTGHIKVSFSGSAPWNQAAAATE